jgi:hypothetical protein
MGIELQLSDEQMARIADDPSCAAAVIGEAVADAVGVKTTAKPKSKSARKRAAKGSGDADRAPQDDFWTEEFKAERKANFSLTQDEVEAAIVKAPAAVKKQLAGKWTNPHGTELARRSRVGKWYRCAPKTETKEVRRFLRRLGFKPSRKQGDWYHKCGNNWAYRSRNGNPAHFMGDDD